MSLKKRIEALEMQQKQSVCQHAFGRMEPLRIAEHGTSYTIEAKCWQCNKEFKRTVSGKLFDEAFVLIRKEIDNGT